MKWNFKIAVFLTALSMGIAAQNVAGQSVADAIHGESAKIVDTGRAKEAKGDLDGALVDFNRALTLDPNNSYAYANRGLIKYKKGDVDGALTDYNRALTLDPNNSNAYFNRGLIKYNKGDVDGALTDFNRALTLDPNNSSAYDNRGVLKDNKGDVNGALADYNRALTLDPNNSDAYNNSAWILATASDASVRNGAKALEYATKACELTEWKDGGDIDTFAAACAETGDYDQAVKWESKYLEMNPSDKEAPSRLALYKNHQPYHEAKK
jgi:Flp pilus assembly protein TadD